MPGPVADFSAVASAAGAEQEYLFDPVATRRLIKILDSTQTVTQRDGAFVVDGRSMRLIAPQYEQLIFAAVTRANCEPTLRPVAQVMDAGEWAQKLIEIVRALKISEEIVEHVRRLYDSVQADPHWWGVSVDLTQDGATALVKILELEAEYLLAILAPLAPKLAAVLYVADAAGKALAAWIHSANNEAGIRLELFMWVVPWVESR